MYKVECRNKQFSHILEITLIGNGNTLRSHYIMNNSLIKKMDVYMCSREQRKADSKCDHRIRRVTACGIEETI